MSNPITRRRRRFTKLAEKAQVQFERAPKWYKLKLAIFAGLGYALIFALLLALTFLIGGTLLAAFASSAFLVLLFGQKLIVPIALTAWALLKAVWVRFESPTGYELDREQAPALFDDIDEMRESLQLPTIHEVRLNYEFNASVAQTPRLGIFGWHKNTIVLGLPLLLALTRNEARAVLAHELGHLSGNHSRFSAWIYRVGMSWYRIMEAFDASNSIFTRCLRRFFDWYAPSFNAMSFALSRANEFEADAIAAELTSPKDTATALIRVSTHSHLESTRFWQPLYARVAEQPEPIRRPYMELARFHTQLDVEPESFQALLDEYLDETGELTDTHPTLRARLQALGETEAMPGVLKHSAAEAWLGENLESTVEWFDTCWFETSAEDWKEQHEQVRARRERLEALSSQAQEDLEPLELWELADLTESFGSENDAVALFKAYKTRQPEDPDADFALGRILLNLGDTSGVAYMEAAQQNFAHAIAASEELRSYYERVGEVELAQQWQLKAEESLDRFNKVQAQRQTVSHKDKLLRAELTAEQVEALREQLAEIEGLKRAWIARKKLDDMAEEYPLYVLTFTVKGIFGRDSRQERVRDQICEVVEFPGAAVVVPFNNNLKLGRRIKRKGARVF